MSWPHLFWAELAVFMVTVASTLVLSFYWDAPLKELANPAIPENPAKAPWYFLGIQELVSYSAFTGGLMIPVIVLAGTRPDSIPGSPVRAVKARGSALRERNPSSVTRWYSRRW